jgi:hypothetical protein
MLFSQELLESLPVLPIDGVIRICDRVLDVTADNREWESSDYDAFMEGFALLTSMEAAKLIILPFEVNDFEQPTSLASDCQALNAYFQKVRSEFRAKLTQSKYSQTKAHYSAMLGAGFVYEFTQGDLDRIQELLGQLRVQIRDSDMFTEEHRRRLLLKFEKLQTELHKKMSSLDRLWGITGELGVVLGKFGNDAKPLVDRFKEIMQITWRTQSRAEDMPSDSPPPLGDDGTSLLSDTAD